MRERCPIGPLKNTGVYEIFVKRLKESGQDPTRYSAYSLRHAFAMRLLKRGVGIKAIGDVLGHRDLESIASICAWTSTLCVTWRSKCRHPTAPTVEGCHA